MKSATVYLESGAEVSVGTDLKGREVVAISLRDRVVWIEMTPQVSLRITTQAGTIVSPGEVEEIARLPWSRH